MAVYVDFTFYLDEYHGTAISIDEFDRYALLASAKVDQLTFDRSAPVITDGTDTDLVAKIQLATCAVADELKRQSEIGVNGKIKSESVGQHSVTYVDDVSNRNPTRLINAAKVFLGSTGLMFPGFASGEYSSVLYED